MSLQVRLRFTKSLLRRSERLCFGLGFASLGLCAAILAHIWFLQAYENWVFEQELSGEPASVAEFPAQTGVIPYLPYPPNRMRQDHSRTSPFAIE